MKISFKYCASIPELVLDVPILFLFSLLTFGQAQAEIDPGFRDVVIFATNSVHIQKNSLVETGDVVVNNASPGPTLEADAELSLDTNVIINGKGIADSIVLDKGASIADSQCNDGTGNGLVCGGGLSFPVFNNLPPFQEAVIRSGAPAVNVANGAVASLAEGDYADMTLGVGSTVIFTGGVYNISSILSDRDSRLEFTAPTELRISGQIQLGRDCFVGPTTNSTAAASNIMLYVGGGNLDPADLFSLPPAAAINRGCEFKANIWAPNGTLDIDRILYAEGAFFGRDVRIDASGQINLASFFNLPPTADPQDVFTSGTTPLDITLTGSDPEGEDLFFEIVSGPSNGTLSVVTQSPPSSATVTYTANQLGDLEDSFTFRVTDPNGGFDEAVVSINPVDTPVQPPEPTNTVIAKDGSLELELGTTKVVTLVGFADVADPAPIVLEFSISSPPSLGTLGTLVGNTVPYNAPASAGNDSFVFQVCGDLNNDGDTEDSGECDTATISITINPFTPPVPPVAEDFSVSTEPDTPVLINLGAANEGSPGINPRSRLLSAATGVGNNGENDGPAAAAPVALTSITVDGGWVFFNDCPIGSPCPASPFTFTTNGVACVSVTDAFVKSDEYTVSDNGQLLGLTSAGFPDDGTTESNADLAFADPEFSSGTFLVSGGSHSIDIVRHTTQLDPLGLAAAYIRVDSENSGYCKPNLTITSFSAPVQADLGEVVGDQIQVTLTNTGALDIPAGTLSSIGFYVSIDPMITTADTLLTGGRENLATSAPGGLAVGESISDFLFSGASINGGSPTGNVYIGVLADEFNTISESIETDNTDSQSILIGDEGGELTTTFATITSLPVRGILTDPATGIVITSTPYPLLGMQVTFTPDQGTTGSTGFEYNVRNTAGVSGLAEVIIEVLGNCVTSLSFCEDGRPEPD